MTSEEEFRFRKPALVNAVRRNLEIIWETPKTLLARALLMRPDYSDVAATQAMLQHVISSNSFSDLRAIVESIGNYRYTLQSFADDDDKTGKSLIDLAQQTSSANDRGRRIEFRQELEKEVDLDVLKKFSRDILVAFARRQIPLDVEIDDVMYTEIEKSFFGDGHLADFLTAAALFSSQSILTGGNIPGQNDAWDYGHLSYAGYVTQFISCDNFFKRKLPQDFFKVKFISFGEYNAMISG